MSENATSHKSWNVWLPLMLAVVMVAGMVAGVFLQDNPPTITAVDVKVVKEASLPPSTLGQGKLEEIIRYIEARYVDEVNKEDLVREAMDKILHELDPHSSYISAEELNSVNEQLEGSFEGIGIEFILVNDTVTVVSLMDGSPALKVGIRSGDQIVGVNDTLRIGKNAKGDRILQVLKGERGSKVRLEVWRPSERKAYRYTLTREKIPVKSVSAYFMQDEDCGYIRIDRFTAHTFEEFMSAMEELVERKGMQNLILDLRQNPGGYLQEAVNILSQFFKEKDKLLVYTQGSHSPKTEYKSTGRNFYDLKNISVLVDEGSASASEILAGAVQDWDRGVIIGRRTFGKGLVQEQYPLRDGSAIRLTVARYYTPSGRCIQKPYGRQSNYEEELSNRLTSGEMYDATKIATSDSLVYSTSKGRKVYGGGGIVPDVFIPYDSLELNTYYIQLSQHIPGFVFRYLEQQREALSGMGLETFVSSYSVPSELRQQFLAYTRRNGLAYDATNWRRVQSKVAMQIKAHIARQLWGEAGYRMVLNQSDPAVAAALEYNHYKDPIAALGR
ncbi:MAG: peptidase S41 [Saprospiraceae bacterium]|nr:MAG: peptidase S41 [Saprospiraceae bacterium]